MPSPRTGKSRRLSGARLRRAAALTKASPEELAIRRRRRGRGFTYLDESGDTVRDRATLDRIRSLAIPPAYEDVRIAADPEAHLQAVGRDEAGRLQYRYHPRWELVREIQKVDRLSAISHTIGRIRRRIARDIRRPAGSRERALASMVMLIDRSHIRIGCEDYVHTGRSRGAATLLKRNVEVNGEGVRLRFPAKGGRTFECAVDAPALAQVLSEMRALPGRRLFQYRDATGRVRPLSAADANAYLQEIAGAPVTAKDFRTLAATAEAAKRLGTLEPAASATVRRRQVAAVIREVADLLGNTPTVARKSYVHRELVRAFEEHRLAELYGEARPSGRRRRGEDIVAALFGPPGE